jgi:Protein of unknown function (DUF3341)
VRSGLVAEFTTVEEAVGAARGLRALGYHQLRAYTPFPVPELAEPLGIPRTPIPRFVLGAGIAGGLLALLVVWWTNAIDFPLDVGGRPLSSWPSDVPIVFETTILFAAGTAFALVFLLSGLPRLYDPIMSVEGFERTSLDRFWIAVDDGDGPARSALDVDLAARLGALGAVAIRVVRAEP